MARSLLASEQKTSLKRFPFQPISSSESLPLLWKKTAIIGAWSETALSGHPLPLLEFYIIAAVLISLEVY